MIVTLQEVYCCFPTQADCIAQLEDIRWNGVPQCPYCRAWTDDIWVVEIDQISTFFAACVIPLSFACYTESCWVCFCVQRCRSKKRGLSMTMVLTCLTRDFIVQAGDRRLVYKQGKKIVHKEDDRNKALIYDNHTLFAYTGLAILSSQRFAIDWAAELLAQPPNLHDAMAHLAERATHLLKTHLFSGYPNNLRRLSFVGAGFINWVKAEQIVRRPAYFIVSNFMLMVR